jgi:competence protein ComEC
MAIISAIMLFILKILRFPRSGQFIFTGLFLLFYALLSGWSPSVVRSVLMAAVLLSSFCLEYEAETMNSLGLAALILFMLNPANLFDIGFQLSFLSVGMIITCHPMMQGVMNRYIQGKLWTYLALAFGISLIAWVGVGGLIAYEFNMVTPIGVIANIPVVCLADMIILLSLGLAVAGLFCPMLAMAFAGALKLIFHGTLWIVSIFAQIPGAYYYLPQIEYFHVFSYYCFLVIVYLVVKKNINSIVGPKKK